MKKVLMISVLLGAFAIANAQDVIYFRNGVQQRGKVLLVSPNDVSYKKAENPDGPNYVVAKDEISMIEYQNGYKDILNSNNQSNNSNQGYSQQPNNVYVAQPTQTYVRPQVNIIAPPIYNTWGRNYGYGYGGGYSRNYGYGGHNRGYCGNGWGYSGHHHHGGHRRW